MENSAQPNKSAWRSFTDRHWLLSNLLLSVISVGFALLLCELVFRFLIQTANPSIAQKVEKFQEITRVDNTLKRFEPHPYLSYARTDTQLSKDGISIDGNFFAYDKPEDTIRVACLGGSTTMRQYPYYLQIYLNGLPVDKKFEVMDFGCDGWTLQESLINYMIRVMEFDPDYVVVHHGINDNPPRLWPGFKRDYTHFRHHWLGKSVSDVERFLIQSSSMFTYFLYRNRTSGFDLQNQVIHQISSDEIRKSPAPGTLQVIENKLKKLNSLAQSHGAELILMPMPMNPEMGTELYVDMVRESNETMRNFGFQNELHLVDPVPFLNKNLQWFKDFVHLDDHGNYYKAQILTNAIHQMISSVKPRAIHYTPESEERNIRLSWDFAPEEATDFHVQVRFNREIRYNYLGRTGSADIKTFQWSYEAENSSRYLSKKMENKPVYGTHYKFRVVAFNPERDPKAIGFYTVDEGLKVWEVE